MASMLVSLQTLAQDNPFLESSYWNGKPAISDIKANMAKGHSITQANSGGFDPTTYAIMAGNPVSTIQFLIDQGNSVNKRTHDSRTYIFWAASRGNLEIMKFLMEKGAKTDLRDSHGYTVTQFAAAGGQQTPEIYDFFIQNGVDLKAETTENGRNLLHILIGRLQDFKMLDYFESKGLSLTSTDNNGNGLFNYAARSGNREVLEKLIKRGVPYGENKVSGENAIIMASTNGSATLDFFKYLENLGLNPTAKTNHGTTALHNLASSNKDLEVFQYFIGKGLKVNDADENGNTPLINAANRNSLEVVAFLAEKTKNINHTNNEGISALTRAVTSNGPEVVDYLLSKGADANVQDHDGNNLGYYLVRYYRPNAQNIFDEKLEALVAKGFSPKKVQGNNKTLFHLAIDRNDLDLLKKVNTLGIDVNAKDKSGNTVLHYAAMKAQNDEVLKYLISVGANLKATTDFEETAYDIAVENEILRENKVDLNFLKAK